MRRSFMKLGALTAMMALAAAPSAGMASRNNIQIRSLEATKVTDEKPSIQSEIRKGTGREGYRRPGTNFSGNQRQYRKKCRQNPCRFNSKKHRSNN